MKVQIGDRMVEVGSFVFATHDRIGAKWHLTGEVLSASYFRIDRIWRDDNLEPYELCWSVGEDADRTVKTVVLGNSENNGISPASYSQQFMVENPKHIFSYDQEKDEQQEETTPKAVVNPSMNGDARLAALTAEWKQVRYDADRDGIEDDELDELGKLLGNLETSIIGTPATSIIGVQCKVEILRWYTQRINLIVEPDLVDPLAKSIEEDLQNLR